MSSLKAFPSHAQVQPRVIVVEGKPWLVLNNDIKVQKDEDETIVCITSDDRYCYHQRNEFSVLSSPFLFKQNSGSSLIRSLTQAVFRAWRRFWYRRRYVYPVIRKKDTLMVQQKS
ncbi:hypothetical protein [Absidia glauca]|uniref:Uncharacterized protein n=1 Tax=Absidia glauca TaxID=4829 RepID=A0A168M3R5_ABSGL|nr:hypothetical protein [Absidia glauca]